MDIAICTLNPLFQLNMRDSYRYLFRIAQGCAVFYFDDCCKKFYSNDIDALFYL